MSGLHGGPLHWGWSPARVRGAWPLCERNMKPSLRKTNERCRAVVRVLQHVRHGGRPVGIRSAPQASSI
ncbi:Hypothetical protein EPM1_3252 [Stenotrophomonas maltophilia EPM1]|nr:Hypothetical protein EPM1_3252 [Stenotrophomonas maltophilia EPM1]